MANYKASWQRKKLYADAQVLGYRMKELSAVLRKGTITQEEADKFDSEANSYVDAIQDWQSEVMTDLTARVPADEE